MLERRVGVLGASGLVGESLVRLLNSDGWQVLEFSLRRPFVTPVPETASLPFWISLVPIWALPGAADLMTRHGVRRIVALSSTSRFSKKASSDLPERAVARRLAESEEWLARWASARHVQWILLRPTLIYGWGRDKNISEIARFIRRFGFFPLVGEAGGLRQPVHAEDVARACMAALERTELVGRAYNLSGGETLAYRDMVRRIFIGMARRPRTVPLPVPLFSLAVSLMRLLPRYRDWNVAMAERMNSDLVFDHAEASRDLGFAPRPFCPGPDDVGSTAWKDGQSQDKPMAQHLHS